MLLVFAVILVSITRDYNMGKGSSGYSITCVWAVTGGPTHGLHGLKCERGGFRVYFHSREYILPVTEVQPSPKQKHILSLHLFFLIFQKRMGKWGVRQTFFGKFHRRRRRKEQKWERDHLHFSPGNSIPFPLRQKKSQRRLSDSFLLASFPFPGPRKEKEKGLELYSLNVKERR